MRTPYIYIAGTCLALLSTGCDNIDVQDRLIPVERPHSEKVVLLEEFTGARCVNCPGGAEAVHSMLESETFAGKIVAVSLYPEQMPSLTTPINVDLRTEAASEYFSAYGGVSKGMPAAMFDRTPYDGSVLQLTTAKWSTVAAAMLLNASPVTISLSTEYAADTRELKISYDVRYDELLTEEVYMQLYVLENGIISKQASTKGTIQEYVNNHVLRTPVNGIWGDSLDANHMPDTHSLGTASVTLDAGWVAENIQVAGFVYRASDRCVLQAHLLDSIL